MTWKILETGAHAGSWNMEYDRTLARQMEHGKQPPLLRLYGWTPPAVSLGTHQQFEEFDLAKLRADGIDIVQRPTGGKAVLHINELTYSVVMRLEGRTPKEIYHLINESLLRGVRLLGIPAELSASDEDYARQFREPSAIPCFTSSVKNEIQVQGKKLIGSAQRRFGTAILQHGSFLLGPEHRQIVNYLSASRGDARRMLEDQLLARTTDARTILGRPLLFGEAAEAIKKAFEMMTDNSFSTAEEQLLPAAF